MPRRPLTPCTQPGCPALVVHPGRCPRHALVRGTSTEQGYGAAWRKIRDAFLAEHSACVECLRTLGFYVEATDVDHVVPRSQGGGDDESNLQSLCKRHHSVKTMRELNRMRRSQ